MSAQNKNSFMTRSRTLTAASLIALSCSGLFSSPAFAAFAPPPSITNWTGLGTDPTNWADPTNWDNGVPTQTLPGFFGTGTTINVAVDASQQPGTLTVDNGSTVNLLPGSVLNDDMIVGDTGPGTFNNMNATHNVTGNLILGNQATSIGTYTVTGDSAITSVNFAGAPNTLPVQSPNGALIVGNDGTGYFTQGTDVTDSNNQVNVAGDLVVGLQYDGTGTYTLNSGTLTVGGALMVGEGSTSNNTFNQNGGSVNITGSANGDSRYASVDPGAVPGISAGTLYVGSGSISENGVGTYNLYSGSVSASSVVIGYGGTGTFNQSGGSVSTGYVDLGDCGGCNGGNAAGFYNLTGSGSLTTSNLSVGDFGHGEFLQNGSGTSNTVYGTLSIGNGATAQPNFANVDNYDRSGTYTLDAGALNTQYTVVGSQGTGTFNQNGGTHAVSSTLTIGQTYQTPSGPLGTGTPDNIVFGGPALGYYNMTNGTLTANGDPTIGLDTYNAGIIVGDAGTGTFTQTGGTVTSGVAGGQEGDLILGNQGGVDAIPSTLTEPAVPAQAGGQGTYNLGQTGQTITPSLQVYGNTILGRGTSASGANPASGTLAIAGNGTAMSVYQTTGFSPQNGGNILVGVNGTGAITQTDQSNLYMDHYLVLGVNAGSTGSYSLSATSTPANSGYNLFVGSDLDVGGYNPETDIYGYNPQTTTTGGNGTFTQTSGDVYVVGSANIGNSSGNNSYTLSGGTLTTGNNLNVGNVGGNGTFTQTGGSVTTGVQNTQEGDLIIGGDAGSTGSYSLTDPSFTRTVTLTVNGNTDIGVAAGNLSTPTPAMGSLTIGSGTDSPTFQTNAAGSANGDVTVGDGGNGSLTIYSGTANIAGILSAGVNGTGTITQAGGAVSASYVDLSTPIGSGSSSYTMTGGTLTTTNDLNVGGGGAGPTTFSQSGTNTQTNVGGTLRVGNSSDTASLTLSGGALNVTGDSYVGVGPYSGTLTQNGGSHSVGGTLYVGDSTSTGLYTLNGGTLSTGITGGSSIGDVVVGNGGTGEIDNTGGQQISNSIDGFTLGWSGSGTYKLTGTGTLSVAANENIGVFGSGTFVQGDGNGTTSNTVGGSLDMSGGYGGPASTYTLNDGSLNVTGSEVVGFAAQATFTQSGGTNTVGTDLDIGLLGSADPTQYGNGAYNLSGTGSLAVTGNTVLGVNAGTNGTFTQTGGSFTTQTLTVGSAGTGVFNQSGGTTKVLDAMTIGSSGTATVTSIQAASITNNNKLILANAQVTAPVTNNGLLEGTGTITGNVTNNGNVHPGDSPGILNVVGDFTQSSVGILDFTVTGTTAGTGYSQLNASGKLNLAGTADITDTSFKLANGDDFTFLTAGSSVAGSLTSVIFDSNLCTLSSGAYACSGNGQNFNFQEIVSSNAVDFKVANLTSAVPLPASLPMFGAALAGLAGFALRRRKEMAGE